MFTVRLADFPIEIDNKYDFVKELCVDYLDDAPPLFKVYASEEEIAKEMRTLSGTCDGGKVSKGSAVPFTVETSLEGYAESICLYREICRILLQKDVLLFHSAAVMYRERAYLFAAPSGTGKTTHLKLWMELYGRDLKIINGDKPLLRLEKNGGFRVYGTPWSGKEGWQSKCSSLLGGICFLKRGENNRIIRLPTEEAAKEALGQVLILKDPALLLKTLQLTDKLLRAVPIFLLHCNISQEAARLSFAALTGEELSAP